MNSAQAMNVGKKMIQLLTQQQLLYRQLQELAGKQSAFVNSGNPEALLQVLASRQRLIDRLTNIDRELTPIRSDWKKISLLLPSQLRRQAQQLIVAVQEILGDIINRDKKDSEILSHQQKEVAANIRRTRKGKQMNQAYSQTASVGQSHYLDTRSE